MNAIAISVPRKHTPLPRRTRFDHGRPISRPDTLPILLFATCLAATVMALGGQHQHALLVDMPSPLPPEWQPTIESPPPVRLSVSAGGTILWNGDETDRQSLRRRLSDLSKEPVARPLQFDPAPDAPYGTALQILGIVGEAGLIDSCLRLMGADKYRNYDRAPAMTAAEPEWTTRCDWSWDHSMPRIIEPRPEPPVDYYIW